jgi:hypothetical protein
MDDDERGAVGGMSGRGNGSTQRKAAVVPVYPPQILHNLSRARIRTAAVERRRLIAWTTARPRKDLSVIIWCASRNLNQAIPEYKPLDRPVR